MPKMKSAIKWTRASAKRGARNLAVKTELKTLFTKATAEGATTKEARTASAAFDKAAARKIIHKNKANRKKSRLATSRRSS